MPRFHLNVHNSIRAIDADGATFPDFESATTSAIRGARKLIAQDILAVAPYRRVIASKSRTMTAGFCISYTSATLFSFDLEAHKERVTSCGEILPLYMKCFDSERFSAIVPK